eukprot:7897198-Ditylum_brightwellii.AAC.1
MVQGEVVFSKGDNADLGDIMHINVLHGVAQQHIGNDVVLVGGVLEGIVVIFEEQAPSTDALTFKIVKG